MLVTVIVSDSPGTPGLNAQIPRTIRSIGTPACEALYSSRIIFVSVRLLTLVIAYIAPFITARDGIARLRNRISGVPPVPRDSNGAGPGAGPPRSWRSRERAPEPKNVTPKDDPPDRRAG